MVDNVTARFHVGSQYAIASFKFNELESDFDSVLNEFITKENIPVYLEDSLEFTLKSLIDDVKKDPHGPNYYKGN